MLPDPLPMHHWSILASGLTARIEAVGLFRHGRGLGLAIWSKFGDPDGYCCTSGPIPAWSAVQARWIGALIASHDVSGTG
jgi:hypothetical protein